MKCVTPRYSTPKEQLHVYMFAWAHINRKSNWFTKLLCCKWREIKAGILELGGAKSFCSMSFIHMLYKRYSAVERAQLKHRVPALWFLLYSPSNAPIQVKEIGAQKQPPDPLLTLLTESCLHILSSATQHPGRGTSPFQPKESWRFFENLITT